MAKNIFFLWTCGLQVFFLRLRHVQVGQPAELQWKMQLASPFGWWLLGSRRGDPESAGKVPSKWQCFTGSDGFKMLFWMIFGHVEVVGTRKLRERMVVGQVRDVLFDEIVLLCFLLNEWSSGSWSSMAKAHRDSWIVFPPDMVVH